MVREQGLLLQVQISGVEENTIVFLVGREVLQVFLLAVKFRFSTTVCTTHEIVYKYNNYLE